MQLQKQGEPSSKADLEWEETSEGNGDEYNQIHYMHA